MDNLLEEFDLKNDNKLIDFPTDFETIRLNTVNSDKFSSSKRSLIRFISDEFVEEFNIDSKLCGAAFLPSHKEKEFWDSLERNIIIKSLEIYYFDDYIKEVDENGKVKEILQDSYDQAIVSHKKRASYGTSFYTCNTADNQLRLHGAKQILRLNSMKDYLIAIGDIEYNDGLLEQSTVERTNDPTTHHVSFWKLNIEKSNINFNDIAERFTIKD